MYPFHHGPWFHNTRKHLAPGWGMGGGLELTTLLWALVVADQRLLVGGTEQSGPVDGVVVAELAVVRDMHVTGTDLP